MNSVCVMLSTVFALSSALCYFPIEYQGEYVTQTSPKGGIDIRYSPITILPESVPIWGICHRRMGSNVILTDRTGGTTCSRCFRFVVRSSNVLQVYTDGLERCYTTEEAAQQRCPTDEKIMAGQMLEIVLYKTKELTGEPVVAQEYCPLNGRFNVRYAVTDGSGSQVECSGTESEISNCPYGFGLSLKFRDCRIEDFDLNFQCLGDWEGPKGERFIALLDTEEPQKGEEVRPRYRCGMYRTDPITGRVTMALSSDSTCKHNLRSSTDGYETLQLTPISLPPFPDHALKSKCRFPEWSQGRWQDTLIREGFMEYKDQRNFRTFSLKCLDGRDGRYLVYGRTQCGDEFHSCMWVERRSINVMELQFGLESSILPNRSLCNEGKFLENAWTTQGRLDTRQEIPCPIAGEYEGILPDAEGLCAKLYSDCNNPEIMFYTVSNCFNKSEIYEGHEAKRVKRTDILTTRKEVIRPELSDDSPFYRKVDVLVPEILEEREYRCMGQWQENSLTYTYTQRRDMAGYECFVGIIIKDDELYIKEAGDHCQRDVDPRMFGMKIKRVGSCLSSRLSSNGARRPGHDNKPNWPLQTTKTWRTSFDNSIVPSSSTRLYTHLCLLLSASLLVLL
ncbi:uncharacterized protein LOC136035380 isoform X2 [Artemia franciscana]|uniref:uncharacterized protein LOC136035380 isoform X2 n=1 Tax=Artemia franciscana TaxID=6661 RepID=UPI0032DB8860